MTDDSIVRGTKIVLRDWREADLEALAYWLQPGHRWKELDAPYYPVPSPQEIEDHIAERRAAVQRHDTLVHPRASLVIAGRDATMIGMVTWYWESAATHWPGVGIVIYDPAHWGRSYGTEALWCWSAYLFAHLPQIVRLDLRTWSGNHGMVRIAEKLGYREEARFRKARIVDGAYYDGLGFGVLRGELRDGR